MLPQTIDSVKMKNYLNAFTIFLRFKEYTDCRGDNKCRNGKNRLQLAGVNTDNINWLDWGDGR